ncbi:MAG: aldehyde dehydrogenase family protein, partial [Planctomycetales bacterium]|nr:aldehyde dehydrogenase family protein [Planctomycetales bacterium]
YAAKVGRRIFAPHRESPRLGAWWLGRVAVTELAEPWGVVLILGPSNYPILLPAVQAVQAIAAGNAALVKPAPGCELVMHRFVQLLHTAGIPAGLIQVLPTDIDSAREAIQLGVDKVLLTGSSDTGRNLLKLLADTLTPATLELGGCDALFVLSQAELSRVADAIAYATQLNGGATCIAPRRVFATPEQHAVLAKEISARFTRQPRSFLIAPPIALQVQNAVQQAIDDGASLVCGDPRAEAVQFEPIVLRDVTPRMAVAQLEVMAPLVSLISVNDISAAIAADSQCPYSLGASIFGPRSFAEHWAKEIEAGCIVINDVIAPTADPRVSFGGRGLSGWGSTRGSEGLRQMTRTKTVCLRRGRWLPHQDPRYSTNPDLLGYLLQVLHSQGLSKRFSAVRSLLSAWRRSLQKSRDA